MNGLLLAEKKDLKDKLSTKFPADHPWRVNYEKVIDVLGQREEELRKASLEREKMLGIIAKLTSACKVRSTTCKPARAVSRESADE